MRIIEGGLTFGELDDANCFHIEKKEQFSRTTMLFGEEGMNRIFAARVAVFGIGGVGGYAVEALCRTGVGSIDLFDSDKVTITNLNRQIIATGKTLGLYKVDVMKDRILEINPEARVGAYRLFYGPETAEGVDLSVYDYIVDAVDTVAAKLELVCRAKAVGVPIISSMGAANKIDAAAFETADIFETSVCPLARVMRRELRLRGIESLKVVYSKETPRTASSFKHSFDEHEKVRADSLLLEAERCVEPIKQSLEIQGAEIQAPKRLGPEKLAPEKPGLGKPGQEKPGPKRLGPEKQAPASNAFVPAAAGLILAGEVIKDLIAQTNR